MGVTGSDQTSPASGPPAPAVEAGPDAVHLTPAAEKLAVVWLDGLSRAAYSPVDAARREATLRAAVHRLVRAASRDPIDLAEAGSAGRDLAGVAPVAEVTLPATEQALALHLPDVVAGQGGGQPLTVAVHLQAAVTEGYLEALLARSTTETERIRRAELAALRQARDDLHSSGALFRAVFDNAGTGIGIADLEGRIVQANEAFASMLGYTVEEFRGMRVQDIVEPDPPQTDEGDCSALLAGRRERVRLQKRYRHRAGHLVWGEMTGSLVRGPDGEPLYTVAVVEDVTKRRRLQQRLHHLAYRDPLTSLPNRTLFQERLAAAAVRRPGARIALAVIDLDDFKVLNDGMGHDVGDRLLVVVAQRLRSVVPADGHLVARLGGDEFAVLVEDPPPGHVARLADQLLAVLAEPVPMVGRDLRVTASIGVVERIGSRTTPAEILQAADISLYWAKNDGRNRWAGDDAERNARDARRTLAVSRLHELTPEQLDVVYQPIVDLRDGRTVGVEALVRCRHPVIGRLEPEEFATLVESTPTIVAIGRHVMTEAGRRVARWNAANPHAPLYASVNVAARQVYDGRLVDDVLQVLHTTGLDPRMLQLELTERSLLDPHGRPSATLDELHALGVRLAVDDFGTGWSNLAYLPRLPLHTVKLAGTLLGPTAAVENPRFVTDLVTLAHGLGLHVTAENVEVDEQAQALRRAGCDTAQGWRYGHPVAWPELVGGPLGATAVS